MDASRRTPRPPASSSPLADGGLAAATAPPSFGLLGSPSGPSSPLWPASPGLSGGGGAHLGNAWQRAQHEAAQARRQRMQRLVLCGLGAFVLLVICVHAWQIGVLV